MPNNIPNSDNESREKRLKNISIFYFIPFAIIVIALICILLFTGIKTFDTKEWSIGLFVLIFLCLTLAILSIIIVVLGLREVSRTLHFNMKGDINDEIDKLNKRTEGLDVEQLKKDIDGLNTRTGGLEDKTKDLEKKTDGLEKKTEGLEVEQLKKDIDGLKTKTNDLEEKTNKNQSVPPQGGKKQSP